MSKRTLELGVIVESIHLKGEVRHIAHCPHGPSVEIVTADDIPDELAAEIERWLAHGALINTATAANPAAALASRFETAAPAIRRARWGLGSERAPAGAGEGLEGADFRRAGADPHELATEYVATAAIPGGADEEPRPVRRRGGKKSKKGRR